MAQDDTAVHWREKSIMRAILDREDIPAIRTYVADKAAAILEAANGAIEAVGRADPRGADRAGAGLVRLCRQRSGGAGAMVVLEPDGRVLEPALRCGRSYRTRRKIVTEREAANAAMRAYLIALVQRRAGELQAGQGGNDPVSRRLLAGLIEGAHDREERMPNEPLSAAELDALRAFDTPTICNALEVVAPERRALGFTTQTLICPFPELPPIVGYARTAMIRSALPQGLSARRAAQGPARLLPLRRRRQRPEGRGHPGRRFADRLRLLLGRGADRDP